MQVKLKVLPGKQIKPGNFTDGLKGHFTKVNKCRDCEAVGDTSDLFYLEPCPLCGGSIDGNHGDGLFVAKWNPSTENWEQRIGFSKETEEIQEGFYEKDEDNEIIIKEPKSFFQKVFG